MALRTNARTVRGALLIIGVAGSQLEAQQALSLRDAVDQALASRPSLKAEAERVGVAEGMRQQAGALPNPEFQFQNENLRPGQTYSRDVDTLAYVVQPLDVLGKRGRRVEAAQQTVVRTQAEYDLAKLRTVRDVKLAYWAALGAQQSRELLKSTVANFQQIVDYNTARLRVGTIAEQDVLRVQLEGERLAITANLAALRASRAEADLLRQIGDGTATSVMLTESLDAAAGRPPATTDVVLMQRPEMKIARASLEEARARARLQDALARPDLTLTYGYKRTQLPDTAAAANTSIAAIAVRVPLFDRNAGNKAAASAETRRQEALLAATQLDVLADYGAAAQEYALRHTEVIGTLQPMREHATNISSIAQAVYVQAGGDLLRLLDAQRSRLDAELAYVQGMVEYQQSIANLEAAEGVTR
ncbi:MAG: TolC family protein [Betaproteobacteria bacterium]|nr:MAG: TolC family protein [Betaproteobacteria bacterium]